ncbi:Transmembrane and coiled-coil domains-containing protein 3 [Kappamyces sp. JEL0680]|nr:Transmembrane and coiled-coil domains-containing protein 3 [Kappamyces sp. JEL0680]
MFFLGLEFNFSKIGRVWSVSLLGSFCLLFLTLAMSTTLLPAALHTTISESIVVGSSVFLSSTAVVAHFLDPTEAETGYGRNIMGDVLLGFLLAIMPMFQQSGAEIAYTAARLIVYLLLFILVSYVVRIPLLFALEHLQKHSTSEVFLLASIGIMLLYVRLGNVFEQSMEISCFVAGVMIVSHKHLGEHVSKSAEAIKQVFGALFFASIGLHIYPSFLYNEGILLLTLTLVIITFKIVLTMLVIHFFFRKTLRNSFIIGVGLAQISEFTFVLSSKAKSAGILSRELFFILIGVTGISMFLSPFVWRAAIYLWPPTYEKIKPSDAEQSFTEVLMSFERRGSTVSVSKSPISPTDAEFISKFN